MDSMLSQQNQPPSSVVHCGIRSVQTSKIGKACRCITLHGYKRRRAKPQRQLTRSQSVVRRDRDLTAAQSVVQPIQSVCGSYIGKQKPHGCLRGAEDIDYLHGTTDTLGQRQRGVSEARESHKPHGQTETTLIYSKGNCHQAKRFKISKMSEFALNQKINDNDDIPIFVTQKGSKRIISLKITPRDDLNSLKSKIKEVLNLKLANRQISLSCQGKALQNHHSRDLIKPNMTLTVEYFALLGGMQNQNKKMIDTTGHENLLQSNSQKSLQNVQEHNIAEGQQQVEARQQMQNSVLKGKKPSKIPGKNVGEQEDDTAKMEKRYVQILQIPDKIFSFVALVDCLEDDHVTRRLIQVWKYLSEKGFSLVYQQESPRMETELLQASNGDIFFIKSENDGALTVKILDFERLNSQNFLESHNVGTDKRIQTDLLLEERIMKNGASHYMLQQPTIMTTNNQKFLVFNSFEEHVPRLNFLNLDNQQIVVKIYEAELFVESFDDENSRNTLVQYIKRDEIITVKLDFFKSLNSSSTNHHNNLTQSTKKKKPIIKKVVFPSSDQDISSNLIRDNEETKIVHPNEEEDHTLIKVIEDSQNDQSDDDSFITYPAESVQKILCLIKTDQNAWSKRYENHDDPWGKNSRIQIYVEKKDVEAKQVQTFVLWSKERANRVITKKRNGYDPNIRDFSYAIKFQNIGLENFPVKSKTSTEYDQETKDYVTFKALSVTQNVKNIIKVVDDNRKPIKTFALSNYNDHDQNHGSKLYDLDLDSDKISSKEQNANFFFNSKREYHESINWRFLENHSYILPFVSENEIVGVTVSFKGKQLKEFNFTVRKVMQHNGIKSRFLKECHQLDQNTNLSNNDSMVLEYAQSCAEFINQSCELKLSSKFLIKLAENLDAKQINKVKSIRENSSEYLYNIRPDKFQSKNCSIRLESLIKLIGEKSQKSGRKEDNINYNILISDSDYKKHIKLYELFLGTYRWDFKLTDDEDVCRSQFCKEFRLQQWRKLLISELLKKEQIFDIFNQLFTAAVTDSKLVQNQNHPYVNALSLLESVEYRFQLYVINRYKEDQEYRMQSLILSDLDSDIMNRIWNKIPVKFQYYVLKEYENDQEQLKRFIANLSLEQLCLTLSIHQEKIIPEDQVPQEYLGLTTEQDQAVETFKKFGQSCSTDCASDQFVKQLDSEQYDDYKSLEISTGLNKQHIQLMQDQRKLNAFISVAQCLIPQNQIDNQGRKKNDDSEVAEQDDESDYDEATQEFNENGTLLHDRRNNQFRQMKVNYSDDNDPKPFEVVEPNLKSKKVITFWEYFKGNSNTELTGFYMTDAWQAYDMKSELLEAQNGDMFFISLSEEGEVSVQILKSKIDEDAHNNENYFETYPIPDNSSIKYDLLRKERMKKTESEKDDILEKVNEILKKEDSVESSKKQEAIQKLLNEQDEQYWMLQHPTIFTSMQRRILVVQSTEDSTPLFIFYRLDAINQSKIVAQIDDAEIFVTSLEDQQSGSTYIFYINGDKLIRSRIKSENYDDFEINDSDIVKSDLIVDLKQEVNDAWKQRYTQKQGRNQKIKVYVEQINKDNKDIESFIIMFQSNSSQEGWAIKFQNIGPDTENQQSTAPRFKAASIIKSFRFLSRQNDSNTQNTLAVSSCDGYRIIDLQSTREEVIKRNTRFISDSDDDAKYSWKFRNDEIHQCLPFIITGDRAEIKGAIIIHEKNRLNTFSLQALADRVENVGQRWLDKPIVGLSYPWLAYSRYNNLIVANFADICYPQKIIKMPHRLRLQSIVGCNFSDRIVIASWNLHDNCYEFHEVLMPKPFQQLSQRDPSECKLRFLFSTRRFATNMTFGPNQIMKSTYIWDCKKPVIIMQTEKSLQTFDRSGFTYNSTAPGIANNREVYEINNWFKRNDDDFIYWIEKSTLPQSEPKLRAISQILNNRQFNEITALSLGEAKIRDFKVTTQLELDGKTRQQIVYLLDRDQFTTYGINSKYNIFERLKTVNLNQSMNLDGEWLKTYSKSSVNNEKLKEHYKIVNNNCLGVKLDDYCVFKDLNSNSLGMMDAREYHSRFHHDKFARESFDAKVWVDTDLKNSSFRMMIYRERQRGNMYCVCYQSPEMKEQSLVDQIAMNDIEEASNSDTKMIIISTQKDMNLREKWRFNHHTGQ